MSDYISRQAAIDAIERNAYRHTYIDQIVDIIKGLPSAQPDCTDCIKNGGDWNCDHVHCHKGISIQPEIIRCKDCKFYSPMNRETKTGICNLIMHQNFGDNWFCAGAERRPDE